VFIPSSFSQPIVWFGWFSENNLLRPILPINLLLYESFLPSVSSSSEALAVWQIEVQRERWVKGIRLNLIKLQFRWERDKVTEFRTIIRNNFVSVLSTSRCSSTYDLRLCISVT
jgi:hypothetical protein